MSVGWAGEGFTARRKAGPCLWSPAEDEQETGRGGVLENSLSDRPVGSCVGKVTQRQQLALIACEGKPEDKGQVCQFTEEATGPLGVQLCMSW